MKYFIKTLTITIFVALSWSSLVSAQGEGTLADPLILQSGKAVLIEGGPNTVLYGKLHVPNNNTSVTALLNVPDNKAEIYGRFGKFVIKNGREGYQCIGEAESDPKYSNFKNCYFPDTSAGDYWIKVSFKENVTDANVAFSTFSLEDENPFNM
ncbi:MAG: hypothetical protein ACPGUD_11175 [Parashewanella sp.]